MSVHNVLFKASPNRVRKYVPFKLMTSLIVKAGREREEGGLDWYSKGGIYEDCCIVLVRTARGSNRQGVDFVWWCLLSL